MIILNLVTLLSGMSIYLNGPSGSSSLNNQWCENHFSINDNCLYLNSPINLYGFFGTQYQFVEDEVYNIIFHCDYSYTENNVNYSFDFDFEGFNFYFDSQSERFYFSSQVDNDTLDSGFNLTTTLFIYNSYNDTHCASFNTSNLFYTQYDYEYGYVNGVFSELADIDIFSYQFNLLSSDELRALGLDYMGENPDYQTGYEQGSKDGYQEGFEDGANSTGSHQYQTGYDEGYSQGLSDGMSSGHITEIFSNIVQVGILPVNVFLAMLNFEIFGINVGQFVSGLLTIAIILIVVRVVTGSSASGGGKGSDSNGS